VTWLARLPAAPYNCFQSERLAQVGTAKQVKDELDDTATQRRLPGVGGRGHLPAEQCDRRDDEVTSRLARRSVRRSESRVACRPAPPPSAVPRDCSIGWYSSDMDSTGTAGSACPLLGRRQPTRRDGGPLFLYWPGQAESCAIVYKNNAMAGRGAPRRPGQFAAAGARWRVRERINTLVAGPGQPTRSSWCRRRRA
jgi:hypothetical protein